MLGLHIHQIRKSHAYTLCTSFVYNTHPKHQIRFISWKHAVVKHAFVTRVARTRYDKHYTIESLHMQEICDQ